MNRMLILQCSHPQWYTEMQATMSNPKWLCLPFTLLLLHLAIIDYQQYQAVVSQKAFRTHPIFSLDTYALLHHWRVLNYMLLKVTASDVATWKRTKNEPYPALPQPTTLLTRSTSNEIRSAVATMPLPPDSWKTRLILPIMFRSLKPQSISSVLLPMSRSRISHYIALAIYYLDLFATTCRQQPSVDLCKKHVAFIMVDKDSIPDNDDTAYFHYAWRLLGDGSYIYYYPC